MTETHRVRDLAKMIAEDDRREDRLSVKNPRNEADENELHVANDRFLGFGLKPITLEDGLLQRSARDRARSMPTRCGPLQNPLRLDVAIGGKQRKAAFGAR